MFQWIDLRKKWLREQTERAADRFQLLKTQSDVDYLAMMCGIELEGGETDEAAEI